MLSNDRFVAVFGSVPAGDLSDVVKIGVGATRQGFGIVPCHPDTAEPMCTLTAAAAKKDPEHHCYHVITDDKQARTILTRLTRNGEQINLAVDLDASGFSLEVDNDNPTVMIGDTGWAWYEGTDGVKTGHQLVPPSILGGVPLQLVGQTNPLEKEEETVSEAETSACGCAERLDNLEAQLTAIKSALRVALLKLQELDTTE